MVLLLLFGAQALSAQGDPQPLNVFNGQIPQADRIFFVAVDGDNSNSGTQEQPWATLNYAVGQVSRGDVIVMRGGCIRSGRNARSNARSGAGRPTGRMAALLHRRTPVHSL
jgi:hypothetical protein